jgi:hypothetical protein
VTASTTIKAETLVQAEGEPPLCTKIMGVEEEEEPPSKRGLSLKEKCFGQVPEKDWNNWKWQFRHRITTVEELASRNQTGYQQIPLRSNPLLSFFD